jgi:putative transposase
VKIFKRDYVRVNPLPDVRTALTDRSLDGGLQLRTLIFRLGYRSPREYIASLQPAACPSNGVNSSC